MARTTPHTYYNYFVYPNFEDYNSRPDDIRRGFNASVSAFQQADIFWEYHRRHNPPRIAVWSAKRDFLIDLSTRDPHFLTIQSVATAYKHLYASGEHYEVGSPGSLGGVIYSPDGIEIESTWASGEDEDIVVKRRGKAPASLKVSLESVVVKLWPAVLGPEEL